MRWIMISATTSIVLDLILLTYYILVWFVLVANGITAKKS
jgi:hypothetical protein